MKNTSFVISEVRDGGYIVKPGVSEERFSVEITFATENIDSALKYIKDKLTESAENVGL